MLIAHRIALDPNNEQATYFARAAGTARFAYNWALAEWKRQYEAAKVDPALPKPSQAALRRQLNAIKREQFPWMLEVTKNAPQMAIIQLGQAFQNFFAGRARHPQFRKKGVHDRFTLTNDQFSIDGCRIRIPNLGWVRMREPLRFAGKLMSATISRVADRWFVSVTVDTPDSSHLPKAENQGAAGVDLGVSALATLSTRETIPRSEAPQGAAGPIAQALAQPKSQAKGIGQSRQGQDKTGSLACPYCHNPLGRTAQAHDRPHAPVPYHRHRGSERARHGEEPPSGALHHGHELLRVQAATGIQGRDARRRDRRGRSLLCQQQDVLGVRAQAR
jgi:putative transposase